MPEDQRKGAVELGCSFDSEFVILESRLDQSPTCQSDIKISVRRRHIPRGERMIQDKPDFNRKRTSLASSQLMGS